jgi:nucleotide-binding universal stress UspA family protein
MPELGRFPAIEFHQFGDGKDDRLVLYAAPAAVLVAWAGIPRKGWRLRALYQRWITPGREQEVKQFWRDAAAYDRDGHRYLLGPTALTLAATTDIQLVDGQIVLVYDSPLLTIEGDAERLRYVAGQALEQVKSRLSGTELESLENVPSATEPLEYEANHVLESALQIAQMARDPEEFISVHEIPDEEVRELIQALEALCRPALVVDGQHRLLGAALAGEPVHLPVVLLPHASWVDQVFQFVLINEAAKKVDTSLLTDIFGNSLTPTEQDDVRARLSASKIDVEARIAAVVADQHPDSPFKGLVKVNLGGVVPASISKGFLTEATIRQLIDGGRGTAGFRTSDEFYDHVVSPTYADREAWESWVDGVWRHYWYAFWRAVRDYYNDEATKDGSGLLWTTYNQTNLTKAVTLRVFQQLFLDKAVERSKATEVLRPVLANRFGEEEAAQILLEERQKVALPLNAATFETDVRQWFLAKGVPVRVFTRPWVKSLDDPAGVQELAGELQRAWEIVNRGDRYVARNKAVFAVGDEA